MAARTYRIKVVRADHQFEVEGDRAFVLQMLKRFENDTATVPSPPLTSKVDKSAKTKSPSKLTSAKGLSAGEFIRQSPFKKHTDFVLAFGYYLEKYSGLTDFTAADINNCYYEAKLESSNTSQMIIQNIRRGFLMEAKGAKTSGKRARRRFTLTQSGQNHLEKAFAKEKD